jgi:hypothetical protein
MHNQAVNRTLLLAAGTAKKRRTLIYVVRCC